MVQIVKTYSFLLKEIGTTFAKNKIKVQHVRIRATGDVVLPERGLQVETCRIPLWLSHLPMGEKQS